MKSADKNLLLSPMSSWNLLKIKLLQHFMQELLTNINNRESKNVDFKLVFYWSRAFHLTDTILNAIHELVFPSLSLSLFWPSFYIPTLLLFDTCSQTVPLSDSSLKATVCQHTDTKHTHTHTKFTEHRTCPAKNRHWKRQRKKRAVEKVNKRY